MNHSSGSYIKGTLEIVRFLLNSEVADKYSDDYIVRHLYSQALLEVLNVISMNNDNPIVTRIPLTVTADTSRFNIPPCFSEVWWVGIYNEEGTRLDGVIMPNSLMSDYGTRFNNGGWKLDGNQIVFEPPVSADAEVQLVGTTNASMSPHYSTQGTVTSSTTVTLDADPDLGLLDLREDAYVGQMFRLLGTTHSDHIIDSYDVTTRVVTLRKPLPVSSGTVTYEVGPPTASGLTHALAARIAQMYAANLGLSRADQVRLQIHYDRALKPLVDTYSNLNLARKSAVDMDTALNPYA